ncbi:hypothetical protein POL68_22490 [Stigmatella sp. ncwal1]|uniref:Glycosyltransferase RgtA/B/C/D-like domain-containing protein n=1 Tax=Stigmatella ashevillensis TaxID=2995309 RepID=A0ABT5DC57_9BACT|nr:hypothetical protein [Stigmatella ashevillena]MDC0711255.1 hypothetical protein [Stigmatella ashevillena]
MAPSASESSASPLVAPLPGGWRTRAPLAFVLGVFGASRAWCWHAGVRFDLDTLPWFFQFIEPELLRTRLLESVYFLHAQPPLFNLFLGAVLKAFPENAPTAFTWLYIGFGLLLTLSLYGLLVQLRIPRWPSAVLTALFMASPATVLYENWLFYTYPEALLLCASALCFHRFVASGRLSAGVALFTLLGTLALTRSAFHLVWYLTLGGLALATVHRSHRRRVLLCLAGPLVLLLALYTKNAVHFGSFSASSWFGMNFAQIALKPIPFPERQEWVRAGQASALVLYEPFQRISAYPPEYIEVLGPDVPVLRRETKASHWPNLNHSAYVPLSRHFAREAFAAVQRHPRVYLETVGRGLRLFLTPASDYFFVARNRDHLGTLGWLYNRYLFGMYGALSPDMHGPWLVGDEVAERMLWNWTGLLLFGLGAACLRVWTQLRHGGTCSASSATWVFLAVNILYVALVSNLFELGENNRLRYPVDPLVLALGAAGMASCLRWRRTR